MHPLPLFCEDGKLRGFCRFRIHLFSWWAGQVPSRMTVIGICEKLEFTAARGALEIVFHNIGWPFGLEKIFKRACAFIQSERAVLDHVHQTQGKLQILARVIQALSRHKFLAMCAIWH